MVAWRNRLLRFQSLAGPLSSSLEVRARLRAGDMVFLPGASLDGSLEAQAGIVAGGMLFVHRNSRNYETVEAGHCVGTSSRVE